MSGTGTGSWVRLAYEAHLAEAATRKADRAYAQSAVADPGLRRAAQVAHAQAARLQAQAEQAIKDAAKD